MKRNQNSSETEMGILRLSPCFEARGRENDGLTLAVYRLHHFHDSRYLAPLVICFTASWKLKFDIMLRYLCH